MAGGRIIVSGVNETIRMIDTALNQKHRDLHKMSNRVGEDLLRQARNRAPIREGTLVDSMVQRVTDRGRGAGFLIEVSGGDTPYARKMHEDHYQARPRSDMVRRISKKTGRAYWTYRKTMKIFGISKRKVSGLNITVSNEYRLHRDGFWIDANGNKHGRKFLTRAVEENIAKYRTSFEALGDKR